MELPSCRQLEARHSRLLSVEVSLVNKLPALAGIAFFSSLRRLSLSDCVSALDLMQTALRHSIATPARASRFIPLSSGRPFGHFSTTASLLTRPTMSNSKPDLSEQIPCASHSQGWSNTPMPVYPALSRS